MKKIIIFTILFAIISISVFAQLDLQPVAIVQLTRSEPIMVRQMRAQMETLVWQNLVNNLGRVPTSAEVSRAVQNMSLEDRRQVLDVMINERLAMQAAERDRVTVTDNELNQIINEFRNQMAQSLGRQPTDSEFTLTIRNQTGMEYNAFRDQMRRQAITEKYLMHRKADVISSGQVPSEDTIQREYRILRSDFIQPETIRFDMIQVPFTDAATQTRARALANQLSQEIGTDPGRFDAAVLRSHVPNSGYMAGDFGFLPLNSQARQIAGDEFLEVAFNMRQGEVSRIIEGPQSFYIIKITQNHDFRPLSLDDIVLDTRGIVTVRQVITEGLLIRQQQALVARATQELVTELRAEATIQIMENNLSNW